MTTMSGRELSTAPDDEGLVRGVEVDVIEVDVTVVVQLKNLEIRIQRK